MPFITKKRADAKRRQNWRKLFGRIVSFMILLGMLCSSNLVVVLTAAESSVAYCGDETHEHTLACYSNPNADVETAEVWEAALPETLTGDWQADLLAVAQSQIGYQESGENYLVAEDGETIQGYNRYGGWYSSYTQDETTPYADWNVTFLFFSIYYAGISDLPLEETAADWTAALDAYSLYAPAAEYTPYPGDLAFLDGDGDGMADRAGVVSSASDAQITVIEGDYNGTVAENTYALADTALIGYADMAQAQADAQPENDPTILGTSTPTVYFAVPIGWTNAGYTIKVYVRCGAEGEGYNKTFVLAMTDTGKKDSAGRKIYSYTFTASECPYGGFFELYFQAFNSSGDWVCQYKVINSSWTDSDGINGKQWTPNSTVSANNSSTDGSWGSYAPAETLDAGEVTELPPVASGKRRVFYDATLSKLSYEKDGVGSYEIPARGTNVIYCWADKQYVMTKLASYTSGGHTYTDVYYVDIPSNCTTITFASFALTSATNYGWSGESTKNQTIPSNLTNPCFYADSSDNVIYDSNESNQRSGYWGEAFTVRDAEAGKNADVVDITTGAFTQDDDTLYLKTTFYDYYTDYELNGKNRDGYPAGNGMSQRNWVTFRQLNQALSSAYSSKSVNWPLYVGHFQPAIDGDQFDTIGSTLSLYGWSSGSRKFYSSNNSYWDGGSGGNKMAFAMQGLIYDSLINGSLMASGGSLEFPLFDADFIRGSNSKNAVLGEVYEEVLFPFTKQDIANNGVEYWVFDSSKTTLAMRYDNTAGVYYLKNVGNQGWAKNVDVNSADQGTYGFFPFNETSSATDANNYNYGFGTRIDLTFRLTEDGTVLDKDGNKVPIEFNFSGDDDVWVFIDGKLALDIGGDHSAVSGKLNFQTKEATVYGVKYGGSASKEYSSLTTGFSLSGANTAEHTLTMFYMERGMWESNMKITFNFPDENQLEVGKEVDLSGVNDLFKSAFNNQSLFTFNIQNLATHYGTVNATGVTYAPISLDTSSGTAQPSYSSNTFEEVSSYNGKSNVLHWKAGLDDSTSEWRHRRYGVYTLANTVNISNMNQLSFYMYYGDSSYSLDDLYIQLVDADATIATLVADSAGSGDGDAYGCIGAGSTFAGKTYGSPSTSGNTWVKVTLDLSKFNTGSSFDKTRVKYIRFGCDIARDIYLADFSFVPSAKENTSTGFITKQYNVPDYGSAATGVYKNAEGAVYTSSETGASQAYVVGSDGTFVLENGETVNFHDQFRRGSYIYLNEVLNAQEQKLYETTWTMYENDVAVTTFGTGSTVTNPGSTPDMTDVSGTVVNDGRTEYKPSTATDSDGKVIQNGNSYSGTRPTAGGFVFRSYASPNSTDTTTKIKVVYTNTVNTGSLTVTKGTAAGSTSLGNESFTFTAYFYDVGGLGLESAPIICTFSLKAGETKTIDGIPLGTKYLIYEATPTNPDIALSSATREGVATTLYPSGSSYGPWYVYGSITTESDTTDYVFYNAVCPTISVTVDKVWKDGTGKELTGSNIPESQVYVQLQRRYNDGNWTAVTGGTSVVLNDYNNWEYTFTSLDKYVDFTAANTVEYEYRVVELSGAMGTVIEDKGLLNDIYTVTYSALTAADDGKTYTTTVTNTYDPTVDVSVTKQWKLMNSTTDYTDKSVPTSVWVQLQRRVGTTGDWVNVGQAYELKANEGWTHTFTDLDARNDSGVEYSYRVMELTGQNGGVITVGNTVSYDGTDYVVSYDNSGNAWTIMNRMKPTATLSITKYSAVDSSELSGVVFKLERMNAGSVDSTFTAVTSTTGGNGNVTFSGLIGGSYRLTELKTVDGYSLLSEPIDITLTQKSDGSGYTATVNGEAQSGIAVSGSVTTVSFAVYNKPALDMPPTGGVGGFEFWILGGLCLTAIPLLLYFFGMRKKGGKYLRT